MKPYNNSDALDKIRLGTTLSPGRCKITGADRNKNWQAQKAKGTTGATNKLQGDDPGAFEVEFDLAGDDPDELEDEFEQWEQFQKIIESTTPKGGAPTALPIYHPDLARNHFTEVVNGGIGQLVHDGKGGAKVKVKFIEHKPPAPKPPEKATAKAARQGRPDPNGAAKQELALLLEQAKTP